MTKAPYGVALLALLLSSCNPTGNIKKVPPTATAPLFRVQTFKVQAGWGYSVFIDDKEYIRQRFIPAIAGETPFASSQQAWETGNYVVTKLKSNSNPSLSRKELQQLHILPDTSLQRD